MTRGVSPLVDGLRTTAIVFASVGVLLGLCVCIGVFT